MNSNSNSFIRVQVRVQKKYFFEFAALPLIAHCYASDQLAQSKEVAPLLNNEFDLSEQTLRQFSKVSIPVNILILIQFSLTTK